MSFILFQVMSNAKGFHVVGLIIFVKKEFLCHSNTDEFAYAVAKRNK